MENITKFYSTEEAAKLTGISPLMLRQGVHSGRFPATKTPGGRKFLFDVCKILAILDTEAECDRKAIADNKGDV